MAFRGGKAVHTVVGKQIDDIVVVGPAPLDDEGKSGLKRDPATNRLDLGDEFRWVADFPLAVQAALVSACHFRPRTLRKDSISCLWSA